MLKRLPILRVCEHIAVGAKHFIPNPERHDSVKETKREGAWAPGVWEPARGRREPGRNWSLS